MVHLLDEIHPGEILHEEFMKPMRVGVARGLQNFSRKTVSPIISIEKPLVISVLGRLKNEDQTALRSAISKIVG